MGGDIPDEIYRRELLRLQTDMVKMTERVRVEGLRIVVFEGRDAAGKGGVIKRITEYVVLLELQAPGRLNCMHHLLSSIRWTFQPPPPIKLGKRPLIKT